MSTSNEFVFYLVALQKTSVMVRHEDDEIYSIVTKIMM